MTLTDVKWLCEIFNDAKHRAASATAELLVLHKRSAFFIKNFKQRAQCSAPLFFSHVKGKWWVCGCGTAAGGRDVWRVDWRAAWRAANWQQSSSYRYHHTCNQQPYPAEIERRHSAEEETLNTAQPPSCWCAHHPFISHTSSAMPFTENVRTHSPTSSACIPDCLSAYYVSSRFAQQL